MVCFISIFMTSAPPHVIRREISEAGDPCRKPLYSAGGIPLARDTMQYQEIFVVQFSHMRLFPTPWTAARQASLSITNPQSLLKLMSIESVMPSNHLILCRPLLLPSSIFPSIRVFSSESVLLIRWPKDWGFSFSISPSNEYSGLVCFRMDWLDLLAEMAIHGCNNLISILLYPIV